MVLAFLSNVLEGDTISLRVLSHHQLLLPLNPPPSTLFDTWNGFSPTEWCRGGMTTCGAANWTSDSAAAMIFRFLLVPVQGLPLTSKYFRTHLSQDGLLCLL